MSETCVKQCYRFATLYRGRGGTLKALFKIPLIFCHWLSQIYKKKKEEVRCMLKLNLLQWVWLCYATLSHEDNDRKWWKSDAKTAAIMVLSYYYVAPVRKVLLQAHHDRYCCLVKLLCICICIYIFDISAYLTTVNQCLNLFFLKIMCYWKDLH